MKMPSKLIFAALILASFTFAFAASAEGLSYGEGATACLGGGAIVGVIIGAPAASLAYAAEKKPAAAVNVLAFSAAAGCSLAVYGASIESAKAAPLEQDLKANEDQNLNSDE
jgi:hypothetical protein